MSVCVLVGFFHEARRDYQIHRARTTEGYKLLLITLGASHN